MRIVRSVIFWLHLTAGCVAGVVILTMALTGALLAFERQILHWNEPAVIDSEPVPQHPAIAPVLTTLQASGQGVPTELVLHNSRTAPIEARFGRERTLFLNPWTAEIIGQPSDALREFFASVERIHRTLGLGMQNAIGRGITGAANLIFLFMVISGTVLWLPRVFNSAGFKARLFFRPGLKDRAREWNWHHVIGIWSAIPLFFIVLTGVIMSYPWASNLLYSITGTQPPRQGESRGPRGGDRSAERRSASPGPQSRSGEEYAGFHSPAGFHPIDELIQTAVQKTPAWKTITITVPQSQDATLYLSIDKSVGGQPEQAFQLAINRQTGTVEAVRRFSDNNAGRKLRAWARFVHTGEEFGLFGQIIAALACLGAILLVWTGISMALRRALARFELAHEQSDTKDQEEQTVTT